MAFANSHVKITMFGTSCEGAEEWSTGFRMGSEDVGGGNFAIGSGFLEAAAALWETFYENANVGINSAFKCTGIKAAIILATGATDIANVETYAYPAPLAGGAGGNPYPPQVALVAQLAAASPIGLGAKGRMYLPGIAHGLPASSLIPTAACVNVANALRTFLDGCETAANSPGVVINASKGRPGVPFTAPVNRRVTQVRVGNVFDTQRRRRNGLTETYSTAALAA